MQVVYCGYCGQQARFIDSAAIYSGVSYGMIYYCPCCDAYVGTHTGTDRPKGSLANAALREKRKAAHKAFDRIWKSGRMSRTGAYIWLAGQMGLPQDQAHIGLFDERQCDFAVWCCNNYRMNVLL